ncbi:hypothetical protein DFQ27_006033 [Actinomortierella ambigua]|uniref:Uncharacterized protein n=1 Tax=Actinomortierella ambigua TaxID=1343610 RepID=A0A9P6U112_9FUNG|nr:hypothetical protein DFQ27_006033 [Actinomortierella ambigua]
MQSRQGQSSKKKVEIVLPSKCCAEKDDKIQQLRDDYEDAVHDKEQLQARLKQLEERVDYKETSARIAAAMLDSEKMELRENTRKLGIQLSTATHERDTLRHEKEALSAQLANSEDERKVLSTQLTDAWRRIPRLKKDYADVLNRLSTTEKEAERLKKDLEKAVAQANTTKAAFDDDKAKWERDRRDLTGEVASLKEKVVSSSSDGGKQMMDFEKDVARIRGHHKMDRDKWETEKQRFLDQIASFRVKLTTLSVQQPRTAALPPPEWLLEKQGLEDKCAELSSRLAAAEQTTTPHTKTDAERLAKLEAKNAALKAKLKEVLEHATTVQAEADQFRTKLGKKPAASAQAAGGRPGGAGRRGGAATAVATANSVVGGGGGGVGGAGGGGRGRSRKAAAPAKSDSESVSESDTIDDEGTASPAPAPRAPRPVRAKRQAAEKKISRALESSSSSSSDSSGNDSDSSDLSSNDLDDLDDDSESNEDGEESVHANEEADTSMDMDEPRLSVIIGKSVAVSVDSAGADKTDEGEDTHMDIVQDGPQEDSSRSAASPPPDATTTKSTRSSGRRSSGRTSRKAADDSDSEFEPPVKVPKPRGKGRAKLATAAKQRGDEDAKQPPAAAGSKRPNESDNIATASPTTPISPPVVDANGSLSSAGLGINLVASESEASSSRQGTPGGSDVQETGSASGTGILKVKKKRRLLGKGLEDYSSIIQGPKIPGSPSTNHIAGLLPSIAASLAAKSSTSGDGSSSSAPSSARSTPLSASTLSPLSASVGGSAGDKSLLSGGGRKNQANKEALNAIKLAFSVPKARKPSDE